MTDLTLGDMLRKIVDATLEVGPDLELTGLADIRLGYHENSKPYLIMEISDERPKAAPVRDEAAVDNSGGENAPGRRDSAA
tara:strand:- start:4232 stop:4474 length:243 start_codon:yes stop_codon:yes gene_type:complete